MSCKVNTTQWGKYLVIKTKVSPIFLKKTKTELLLRFVICYGKLLVSKKKSLVYEGVISLKNTFVNIFDFVCKSQSLIKKFSAVKKKVCFQLSKVSTAILLHLEYYVEIYVPRWLKPNCTLVKSFIPFVLCTMNMLFVSGLIKIIGVF